MNKKKLSIITVVKNDEKNIEKTIKSIVLQKKSSFEYIIIDGYSKDNTINIVKK
jgi:glycosyltransferase involved in cell wall biosynthesis